MYMITWNSQGINLGGYQWRIKDENPDVMVVQEVGNLPKEFGFTDQLYLGTPARVGKIGDYNCWWCGWTKKDDDGAPIGDHFGNLRCSLAMFYKDNGAPTAVWADEKRPMLKKTISAVWLVCNIHAGGKEYVIDSLRLARVWGKEKNWVVAGDFNQEPPTVKGWIDPQKEFVVAPPNPTRPRSGKILDFAVSNRDGLAKTGPQYMGSDHLSVNILLK